MQVAVPVDPGMRLRPLLRREYDQLVEAGAFVDAKVELLEGALVEMSPEGPWHGWVIDALAEHLIRSLPRNLRVSIGHPWAANDVSEPEPDLAIIPRAPFGGEHPSQALLLIEVSYSSRRQDLTVKAAIYAAAGVPDYWVVDLVDDVVHVHRDPSPEGYASVQQRSFADELTVAGVPVRLTELLA